MTSKHWIGALVLLAVGYYVGTTYPAFWKQFAA